MSSRVLNRLCDPGDPAKMHEAFAAVGWDKPVALFGRYLQEHAAMSAISCSRRSTGLLPAM